MIKSPTITPEEEVLFSSLRAKQWDEFLGQQNVKHSLQISIQAARQRGEPMDHTLFYGPPGLGKTTLSHLIAKEMESHIHLTSGTALSKVADLAAILTNLQQGDILFIDEIHRIPKVIEETLYPAMEDFALDIVIGKGPSARTVRLELAKFTLVGATTRFGALAAPFRDRFGLIHRLDYYSHPQLGEILHSAASKLDITIEPEASVELARRARGTPRIALKLLKRVRDYVQIQGHAHITFDQVSSSLNMFDIDTMGLDHSDRRLLEAVITKHQGGPVGLSTIAAIISEDMVTIEEVLEPYLLQVGFIKRTPRGRVVTPSAYAHLGMEYTGKENS